MVSGVMHTLLLFARLAGAASYVHSYSGALAPAPARPRAAVLALEEPTEVLAVVAATLAGGAAFVSQTSLFGSKDKKAVSAPSPPSASPPPLPPPPPKAKPKPPASRPPYGKAWPSRGGSGGPHRMSGTLPKEPPRELWWPPVGGGGGYHRMAGRLAPAAKKAAVSSEDDIPTSMKTKRIVGLCIALVASIRLSLINRAIVIAATFVLYGLEQSTTERAWRRLRNGVRAGVSNLFRRKGEWPAKGGTSGYHRMAGRLGKTVTETAAAAATPSATPAASVVSWYDAGTRMR